jgi:hypothetical protein
MKRRLRNVLAVVSLVLFLGSASMWVRSQFAYDVFVRQSLDATGQNMRNAEVRFSQGRFEFYYLLEHVPSGNAGFTPGALRGQVLWSHSAMGAPIDEHREPCWFKHPRQSAFLVSLPASFGRVDSWSAGFQLWLTAVVAVLPVTSVLLRGARNRRAAKSGRCVACGYDLRATPDRCPECGTIPANAIKAEM